jgi:hypothetical protein
MMNGILQLLREGDSFAAIERVQVEGTPLEIAARYQNLVSNLYWKAHDLSRVVTVGRAGILYCLGQSLVSKSPEEIETLRSIAKGLAFDVGSFTWPGWEEPGIDPTAADLALGMDCARLNLRLAIELKKPADRLSMAHWLVGAQALAARDCELAEQQFQLAVDVLPPGDFSHAALQLCNSGYLAIAYLAKNPADAATVGQLDQILEHLSAQTDDDSKTYLAQLISARRLFV